MSKEFVVSGDNLEAVIEYALQQYISSGGEINPLAEDEGAEQELTTLLRAVREAKKNSSAIKIAAL